MENTEDKKLLEIIIYDEKTKEVFGVIPFNDPNNEMILKYGIGVVLNYGKENHKYIDKGDHKIYLDNTNNK